MTGDCTPRADAHRSTHSRTADIARDGDEPARRARGRRARARDAFFLPHGDILFAAGRGLPLYDISSDSADR